jgi:hypothetical protein
MPAPNYNPQHNFKVCKFTIWLSPTSIPRASLSKLPMIPHLQKCRCQSAHTKIRQTDPDHHIQTKYHIYNKHSKYKPLHTCNIMDNTFKWCPQFFQELYTIHGFKNVNYVFRWYKVKVRIVRYLDNTLFDSLWIQYIPAYVVYFWHSSILVIVA